MRDAFAPEGDRACRPVLDTVLDQLDVGDLSINKVRFSAKRVPSDAVLAHAPRAVRPACASLGPARALAAGSVQSVAPRQAVHRVRLLGEHALHLVHVVAVSAHGDVVVAALDTVDACRVPVGRGFGCWSVKSVGERDETLWVSTQFIGPARARRRVVVGVVV